MRAVQVSRFGGPEVLEPVDVAEPRAGDGEVVIDVAFVEVLFLDTQLRAGWGKEFFPMHPPWVPGTGVAGTLAGSTQRVVARTGDSGAYAERVAVPRAEAIPVPEGVDLATAVAAVHDGVLALDRLDRAGLHDGSRVLITAAAGSAGHWFVPLAKAAGAHVAAAAGGDRKLAAVRGLGADVAVDYRSDDWVGKVGGPFDVVFDGAGGAIGTAAFELTVDGGLFFNHGAASGGFAETGGRNITLIGPENRIADDVWRELIRRGLDAIAAATVRPAIGQRSPLERAADAHAAMADRSVIGKTLLVT